MLSPQGLATFEGAMKKVYGVVQRAPDTNAGVWRDFYLPTYYDGRDGAQRMERVFEFWCGLELMV